MTSAVDKIIATVLYEGYLLWPYRRSARKNQKRWTLGGVYPRAFSEAGGGHDPWCMQTECLVTGTDPVVTVRVRFLQVLDRQVLGRDGDGTVVPVDQLTVGARCHVTWDEATERELVIDRVCPAQMERPLSRIIEVPAGSVEEILSGPEGTAAGLIRRRWEALAGTIRIAAVRLGDGLFKVTVKILNSAPCDPHQARDAVLKRTFVSAHTVLMVEQGAFVSLMDPPAECNAAAEACENVKTWPVLLGQPGETHAMLSSPIILYDYPQVAPESPGDLFDGGEIDQLLLLNILSLSDEEKAEMRASDPRGAEILARCETLGTSEFMRLHGAIRDFRELRPAHGEPAPWERLERSAPRSLVIGGREIRKGSRVRVHPAPGGDILDLAMAGKIGVVASIEQDFDDRTHLTVALDEDPGRDLAGIKPGHSFFFRPEEIEPIDEEPEGYPVRLGSHEEEGGTGP